MVEMKKYWIQLRTLLKRSISAQKATFLVFPGKLKMLQL